MDAWWEAVAVLRRRHLHRGQQPGVQGPARAHRRLGRAPSSAPAGTCCRSRSGRRRAARGTPTRCRPTSRPRSSRASPRRPAAIGTRAGPRHRAGQHALLRPRGLRPRAGRLPPGGAELHLRLDRGAARAPATGRASTPTSPPRSPRSTTPTVRPNGSYTMPDDIWFAWANGRPTRSPTTGSQSHEWDDHARIHQYALDVAADLRRLRAATIDANWVDVGQGSVGAPSQAAVQGRRRRPAPLPDAEGRLARPRGRGRAVRAAQAAPPRGPRPSGKYDARTVQAVQEGAAQAGPEADRQGHPPHVGGAAGPRQQPLVKVGSTGDPVRRLQRALTAALGQAGHRRRCVLPGDRAGGARRYQRKAGLPETGVVTDEVWSRLTSGR